MIETINSKALKLYYEDGNSLKLPSEQLKRIARIMTALDAVSAEEDIRQLGAGIHKLSGPLKEFWSIKISGNYRIIFRYADGNIFDVDYIDYH